MDYLVSSAELAGLSGWPGDSGFKWHWQREYLQWLVSTIKYKVLEFGNNLTKGFQWCNMCIWWQSTWSFDDSTIDFVDVTSAFDDHKFWQKT